MQSSPGKPRSAALDTVRVAGIVAVVVGHVLAFHPTIRAAIYSWHVPVFFVLTGYLWTHGRAVGDEVRRRARTLGRPYVAWLLIIGIPWVAYLAMAESIPAERTAGTIVVGAGLGRPFSAFWFVAALFVAAVLWRVLERAPRWAGWAAAGAGVVAAELWGSTLGVLPLSAGVAVPALVFLLAGQQLRRVRTRVARPGLVGAGLVAVGGCLVASGASEPLDMKAADLGTPVLGVAVAIALSAGLVLLAEAGVPAAPVAFQRLMTTLAGTGMAVVLVHAAVLWIVAESTDMPRPVTTVVVLVVSWLVACAGAAVRWDAWLLGRPAPRTGTRAGATSGVLASTPSRQAGDSVRLASVR